METIEAGIIYYSPSQNTQRLKPQHMRDHFSIPSLKATPAERLEPFQLVRRYLKRRWNQRKPFAQRAYVGCLRHRLRTAPAALQAAGHDVSGKLLAKRRLLQGHVSQHPPRPANQNAHQSGQPGHGRTHTRCNGSGGARALF